MQQIAKTSSNSCVYFFVCRVFMCFHLYIVLVSFRNIEPLCGSFIWMQAAWILVRYFAGRLWPGDYCQGRVFVAVRSKCCNIEENIEDTNGEISVKSYSQQLCIKKCISMKQQPLWNADRQLSLRQVFVSHHSC